MSSTYNGNPASGAWTPAIPITEPADLDLLNAASVNAALSKLADYIAFLQNNAGQKGGANTWTAAQTLQAIVSLTNNLAFSAAVAQTLLKTAAGGLTVGTAAAAGDLTLSANGVALLKLLASGSMDAQGKVLANLGTATNTGDALRKETIGWGQAFLSAIVFFTWGGGVDAPGYSRDQLGIVRLKGSLTAASTPATPLFTGALPAGYRPLTTRHVTISTSVGQAGVAIGAGGTLALESNSTLGVVYYLDGVSFVAEQ